MHSTKEYLIHSLLFILTLITATLAGGEWVFGKSVIGSGDSLLTWEYFWKSTSFSLPFIGILLIHELGHYFTSIYHKVKCSLPFFIPAWLGFIGAPSIGTFGAVIRMKGFVNSRIKFFDIGVAGPIAGFVIALGVLTYGFTNLPPAEYIYGVHPEYANPDFKGYGEDVLEFSMIIYNRWGQKLYQSYDMENGWDGKTKLGDEVVDGGVYFYRVEMTQRNGLKNTIEGHVQIIK